MTRVIAEYANRPAEKDGDIQIRSRTWRKTLGSQPISDVESDSVRRLTAGRFAMATA